MNQTNFSLLKRLCSIHAPSGNEILMTNFLLDYINDKKSNWLKEPEILFGDGFQNCIVLVFGTPEVAVYAHIDNIGFTARYNNQLIKIGSPKTTSGIHLVGTDKLGGIECTVDEDNETGMLNAIYERVITPGTDLSFKCDFREDENFIQSCYLDNRLGVWVALQIAETLKNGAIVFSCWEEHGGGSVGYLTGFLYTKYHVSKSLICDITWVTEGVQPGLGVAVSIRDSGIPRRKFVERITEILDENKLEYQVEVESSGGSDGNEIQKAPYPIDWCFIGAPEEFVHSPNEKVHKRDVVSMLNVYKVLMEKL